MVNVPRDTKQISDQLLKYGSNDQLDNKIIDIRRLLRSDYETFH